MAGCCAHLDYRKVFNSREARRNARRYRTKGLDPSAKWIVDFLKQQGLSGLTVLEVGGGIGSMQIELLRAGASRTVNVELSAGYEEVANDLLREAGFEGSVERRIMDFVEGAEQIDAADIVIMHRVVCCYPHIETLVSAAASRSRRWLAMSFPTDAWWNRLSVSFLNLWCSVQRCGFRSYVHSPDAILAVAQAPGLHLQQDHRGWIWQTAILERLQGETSG